MPNQMRSERPCTVSATLGVPSGLGVAADCSVPVGENGSIAPAVEVSTLLIVNQYIGGIRFGLDFFEGDRGGSVAGNVGVFGGVWKNNLYPTLSNVPYIPVAIGTAGLRIEGGKKGALVEHERLLRPVLQIDGGLTLGSEGGEVGPPIPTFKLSLGLQRLR